MSGWLIALVGVIYLGVALDQFRKGNTAMGIVYLSYSSGNVGFYIALK